MLTEKNFTAALPKNEKGSHIYTTEEINEAVRTIQSGVQGREYETAMSRLIKQFYPFILKTALKLDKGNCDDKIMVGCEGLLYAARRFNLESGNQFFTFASLYISGYMKMDFRSTRLIKLTSTMEKELKKPGNAVAYSNVTCPLSLDKIAEKISDSDNKKGLEDLISDGISYENLAVDGIGEECVNRVLEKVVFSAGEDEAYAGLTWAETYCHLNGLFGYCRMSMKEFLEFFDIPKNRENDIRMHCRKIKNAIKNSCKVRKALEIPYDYEPPVLKRQKKPKPSTELPYMHIPKYTIDKDHFNQIVFSFDD